MRTILALLLLSSAVAHAAPKSEADKIEALIHAVENLPDAKFIRNGIAYDGTAAGKHLREKWRWKNARTARDFIAQCASVSTQTGQPYLIRFKDGREIKSSDFFNAELKKIESP